MKLATIAWIVGATLLCTLAACAPVAPAASVASSITGAGSAAKVATREAISATATTVAAPIVVMPLDPTECENIHQAIAKRLGVTMEVAVKDFASNLTNRQGTACTISATGTGKDFNNFVDTAQAIREVLLSESWKENQAYIVDGPTGTVAGFEKENKMALVHVNWQPSPEANCPAGQPVSACDVRPSQQDFSVVIELAQTNPQE